MKIKNATYGPLLATALNLLLAYAVYMITRVAYVWENWDLFADGWSALNKWQLLWGSLRFDTSAIAYTNTLYVLLMLLPCRARLSRWWQTGCKWLFVVVNSLAGAINLADAVYSQFTGRRTTSTFFSEFSNEGNLGTIFVTELVGHWYFVLLGVALIAALWLLYSRVEAPCSQARGWRYYVVGGLAMACVVPLSVIGIRGGVSRSVRPIAVGNANQYVGQPSQAAIVLNTPFSMLRTIGKTAYADPAWLDDAEARSLCNPVHPPQLDPPMPRRNVVVLIVESFAREYIGFYNRTLDGGTYKGYTPFADSLLAHSLTFEQTYANGRKSIDAMPAVLSSIPMFVEPLFVTPYALNTISGLAGELGHEGYSSAFFHGADNGSMGFQAFARSTGFERYYGRTEYDADPRFGGEADFDGTWAIWDEPYLQHFALTLGQLPRPFVAAVFTASSHHPFAIPEQYLDTFAPGPLPIHRCIRYTDHALRRFFATASRQPWYDSTIFVLTSDHTNLTEHAVYKTAIGPFCAPIAIFDPSGQLPRGVMPGMAQQIDIMPTLLSLLGCSRPYVAFGRNLLPLAPPDSGWTVNYYSGIYQYLQADTLLLFDGQQPKAAYRLSTDPLMQHPLPQVPQRHVRRLKAIIQQYMRRMIGDSLTVTQPQSTL